MEPQSIHWLPVLLALAAGLLIGLALGYGLRPRHNAELERKLHDTQEELDRYRATVQSHFGETARLVNELTHSYRAVYQHLSESSHRLCPDALEAQPMERLESAQEPARDARRAGESPPETPSPRHPVGDKPRFI